MIDINLVSSLTDIFHDMRLSALRVAFMVHIVVAAQGFFFLYQKKYWFCSFFCCGVLAEYTVSSV